MKKFPNGLTVKELKELLTDWPETNEDGEPTEVWIETERGLSSIVTKVWPLNKREHSTDLLLESHAPSPEAD